ncbi:MAG: flavin reductase [Planctomycetes bacterium]|nr:flavin reductase [Planctomycetota bacterium]
MNDAIAATFDAVNRLGNRPVWLITAAHGGARSGLTATWVAPVSLDTASPLFLISLAVSHFTTELIERSGAAVIHLLGAQGSRLAWQFAACSGRAADKFAGVATTAAPSSLPVVDGALAWFDCRVIDRHHTGDRVFLWLEPVAVSPASSAGAPLVEQDFFAALSPTERDTLRQNMQVDIARLTPLRAAWRDRLRTSFALAQ